MALNLGRTGIIEDEVSLKQIKEKHKIGDFIHASVLNENDKSQIVLKYESEFTYIEEPFYEEEYKEDYYEMEGSY
jgi:hypothetical protein